MYHAGHSSSHLNDDTLIIKIVYVCIMKEILAPSDDVPTTSLSSVSNRHHVTTNNHLRGDVPTAGNDRLSVYRGRRNIPTENPAPDMTLEEFWHGTASYLCLCYT